MRKTLLSFVSIAVAFGLVATPRPALAAPAAPAVAPAPAEAAPAPASADPRVAELQTMHADAQQRVERYNTTHDASHLAAARELLARWLVQHRSVYGDTPEAKSVRAPIEQQLGMVDAELLRVGAPTTPTAAVAPAPAPTPVMRPAMTPAQATALRQSRALVTTGATATVVGGLTLVAASLPLWMLRDRALRRANEQTFYVDEQRLVARARRRHAGAIATFAVGMTLAAVGVGLMTVGGLKRARVRRELAIVPEIGFGFAGASATLRF